MSELVRSCRLWPRGRSVRAGVPGGFVAVVATAMSMLMGNLVAAEHDGKPSRPKAGNAPMVEMAPKKLFETHCGVCHSLELPRSQRLDRNTWRWVMDDMVDKYGATWITEKQQERIIDYLTENYGPQSR
jgi:hypothetical protein